MTRLRREEHAIGGGRAEEDEIIPDIDAVIFLDRSVDLISPMCTPLTYEALIDEILGIEHTYDHIHSEILSSIKSFFVERDLSNSYIYQYQLFF